MALSLLYCAGSSKYLKENGFLIEMFLLSEKILISMKIYEKLIQN